MRACGSSLKGDPLGTTSEFQQHDAAANESVEAPRGSGQKGMTAMSSSDPFKALPRPQGERDLVIGGSVLCAAVVAGVLACLPILDSSFASANALTIASQPVSNIALKSDRLPRAHREGEDRSIGGIAHPAAPAKTGAAPKWQLPMGCESAFGALVRPGNTAARCVTDLAPPTRFAAAADAASQAVRM